MFRICATMVAFVWQHFSSNICNDFISSLAVHVHVRVRVRVLGYNKYIVLLRLLKSVMQLDIFIERNNTELR